MGLREKRAYLIVELVALQDIDADTVNACREDRVCNEVLNEIAATVEEEE